jgi:hypothetical protein
MSLPNITPDQSKSLTNYWKTIVFVLGAVTVVGADVVETIATGSADGQFSTSDWYGLALLIITGLGVFFKRNVPGPGELADPAESVAEYDPKTTNANW